MEDKQKNTNKTEYELLQNDEKEAHRKAEERKIILTIINYFSSFKIFAKYLITIESLASCGLTIFLTVYIYYRTLNVKDWYGQMDWTLLGFAVVTPMSTSIGLAFNRREEALRNLAGFRAAAWQLYLAHSCWDWRDVKETKGRSKMKLDSLKHSDVVLKELISIGDELCRFLNLPNASRGRHRVTKWGRVEAARTTKVGYRIFHSLYTVRISKLTKLTEDLKEIGLPANEASRIRDWERRMGTHIETIRMIKMYRTPQALRSFARLFTFFLPPLYAPTYAQLAKDVNSLGMGIVYGILTSLVLSSLYNSIYEMEDPFKAQIALDGIDVHEELDVLHYDQLVKTRNIFFPGVECSTFSMNGDPLIRKSSLDKF